ncbi:MAG: N-acetylmuramoyl-L-alanine amidase [Verrucomicrobia bacterium]|nr:N-acetylmuramoyl-L-alanine amidase [Verrucomicrobiota bacterium]MDA1066784.1 N-acetylmuramoyl-L-alanine amidase [Verrucomicrobiota bacterium]
MDTTFRHLVSRRDWLLGLSGCASFSLSSFGDPPPTRPDFTLYNTPYVDLAKVAGALGMKYQLSNDLKDGVFSSQWTKVRFKQDSRLLLLNNYKIYLGYAVALHQGRLFLSTHDFDKAIKPLLTPQVFTDVPSLKTIVIDLGHGGKNPGCINNALGMIEKDMTLDLSKRLQQLLESRGYRVYLTRTTDQTVENGNRPLFASKMKADLFVCLHFNAVESRSVHGIETYTFTPKNQPSTARSRLVDEDRKAFPANRDDPWSTLSGFYVQRQMIKTLGGVDRGLKKARFSMMIDLQCPGFLVEGGFFSNFEEAKKIKTVSYRTRLAEAVMQGITTYHKTLSRISNPGA